MLIDGRDNAFNYIDEDCEYNNLENNYNENNYLETNIYEENFLENNFNSFDNVNTYIFNNFRPNPILTNSEVGFLRGTMFNDIYDNYYKKLKKINTTNERERALLKVQELTFASIDLGLYLDIHPNDKEILKLFKNYNRELEKVKKNYEKIYGPLTSECDIEGNEYEWIKNPWPFEKGGSK